MVRRLGTAPDPEIAAALGLNPWNVRAERERLGIPNAKPRGAIIRWTRAMTRLLGTASDRQVARHLNLGVDAVQGQRIKLGIPAAILAEATLAYIGIGVQAPRASWGSLVADGQQVLRSSPWLVVFPALCIATALISFTFLGDGLRDALDPKLKGKQ